MPDSPMPGSRDVNLQLGGLLLDMAALAGRSQRAWGYKRAAKAVLRLDRHITPLVESNTLRAVPGIGAELVLSIDGELRRSRLYRAHEQAEHSCAIADTKTTFEANGWS